jgi:hypothetical protein
VVRIIGYITNNFILCYKSINNETYDLGLVDLLIDKHLALRRCRVNGQIFRPCRWKRPPCGRPWEISRQSTPLVLNKGVRGDAICFFKGGYAACGLLLLEEAFHLMGTLSSI